MKNELTSHAIAAVPQESRDAFVEDFHRLADGLGACTGSVGIEHALRAFVQGITVLQTETDVYCWRDADIVYVCAVYTSPVARIYHNGEVVLYENLDPSLRRFKSIGADSVAWDVVYLVADLRGWWLGPPPAWYEQVS